MSIAGKNVGLVRSNPKRDFSETVHNHDQEGRRNLRFGILMRPLVSEAFVAEPQDAETKLVCLVELG